MLIPIWVIVSFSIICFTFIVMGVTAQIRNIDLESENSKCWMRIYDLQDERDN